MSRVFLDLLQTERKVEVLLRRDVFLLSYFSVVMNDYRNRCELQIAGKPGRVDDFVNGAMEPKIGGIAKETDQRIVHIARVRLPLFVISRVPGPAWSLVTEDVIALY